MQNKSFGNIASAVMPKEGSYLGDVSVVDMLVRDFIGSLGEAETPEAMVAQADRMALIFSGSEPAYSPIPGWNTRDQLGLYIVKHYGKANPNASLMEILKVMFLDAAQRFLEAVKIEGSQGPEAMEFQIDALIEELVAVLTSTWEITFPPEE